jgi:hypothetical protein
MKRRPHRLERLKAVVREYEVARIALERLGEPFRANPALLTQEQLKQSDFEKASKNLEGTYLLRLFAEFEGTLRDAWENCFKQTTTPPMRDLIEAVGARRSMAGEDIENAHAVRAYRNSLVHEGGESPEVIPLDRAKQFLCKFISWLPLDW